jgi:hypothetical protein
MLAMLAMLDAGFDRYRFRDDILENGNVCSVALPGHSSRRKQPR